MSPEVEILWPEPFLDLVNKFFSCSDWSLTIHGFRVLNRFVQVERSVVFSIEADGFIGVVFLGHEDGGEVGVEGLEVIPFCLLEAEEFFLMVLFGFLVFFEEGESLIVLFLFLLKEVELGLLFFLPLLGGALVFAFLFEVGEFLLLVFDLGFENEPGAGFDGVIVHGLKLLAGGVSAIDNFVNAVADAFCAIEESAVGFQFVQFGSAFLECFEVTGSGETDDIGGESIDEVGNRVVGFLKHAFDIAELKKDHELGSDERFIGSADSGDVEIHLVGNDAEFFEAERARDFATLAVVSVPLKLVEGFGGSRDIDGRAVKDAVGDFSFQLIVNNDGFMGIQMSGFFWNDVLV